jgi:hypothetical protein
MPDQEADEEEEGGETGEVDFSLLTIFSSLSRHLHLA